MLLMRNPWLDLDQNPADGSYVLDCDRAYINQHNSKYLGRIEKMIMTKSIPEPFIGDPTSARLILLNLNPGHSEQNEEEHRNAALKEALCRNLCHEEQEYPFYPMNPAFAETGVGKWWRRRTRKLQESAALSNSELAKRIFVIEWFPYHSQECGLGMKPVCGESQKYSHQLARQMPHKNGVVILGMKARSRWAEVDRAFEQIPFLNSSQNAYLTRNNMPPGVFERIVAVLKENFEKK